MKRSSYAAILLLAFATAYAINGRAQTTTAPANAAAQQAAPASQSQQNGVVTPAKPQAPSPQAQQPNTTSPAESSSASLSNQISNSDLASRITAALHNDADLAGSSVTVNVTDTTVELNGTVSSGTAKTSANRLAQSYAMNRRVKDNVAVVPRNAPAVTTQPNATAQQPAGSPITQPAAAQPNDPSKQKDAQQKGDASEDPRKPH